MDQGENEVEADDAEYDRSSEEEAVKSTSPRGHILCLKFNRALDE